jgi:hypothetical protein
MELVIEVQLAIALLKVMEVLIVLLEVLRPKVVVDNKLEMTLKYLFKVMV